MKSIVRSIGPLIIGMSFLTTTAAFSQVVESTRDTSSVNAPDDRPIDPAERIGEWISEFAGRNAPKQSAIQDPTIPSDEILRRTPQQYRTSAEDLFSSAKRLAEAGLTIEARHRVERLLELEDAPLELQDEVAVWWASIAPDTVDADPTGSRALLESARRLAEAGLTVEARQRIDRLLEVEDAPLEVQDEAAVWWAGIASGLPAVEMPSDNALPPVPMPAVRSVPRPPLPRLTLKGLVLSAPDRGTAILGVDDATVSISLIPREQQQRVPIPSTQLANSGRLTNAGPAGGYGIDGEAERETVEMCLECSFYSEGTLFNLEGFTSSTLLLRTLPWDEVVLVKK